MKIQINKHLPITAKPDNEYLIVKIDISRIVFNGRHMIMVISTSKGGYALSAEYKNKGYGASLPYTNVDDAAKAAPAFFEAVKAGHDSFEVSQ